MEEKKVDRRIAKTKKAIYRAFAQLLSEKNINDITIKDIADRADINRKTFYNYYDGIYELTGEIENKIIDSFEKVIREHNVNELLQIEEDLISELEVGKITVRRGYQTDRYIQPKRVKSRIAELEQEIQQS